MISGKRETSRQKKKKKENNYVNYKELRSPKGEEKGKKKKVDIYSTVEITFLDLHKIVYN